ncbi:MAG: hypothetical protein II583_07555, partial [Oscillospiraceae bacterium]|nr:hypothetical protein [Oscillospiraceae bacterium]
HASQRSFSALFAPCRLMGVSPSALRGTKIPRKFLAVRCLAVLTEQFFVKARKAPQTILVYYQGG